MQKKKKSKEIIEMFESYGLKFKNFQEKKKKKKYAHSERFIFVAVVIICLLAFEVHDDFPSFILLG